MCAGHGMMQKNSFSEQVQLKKYQGKYYVACSSISIAQNSSSLIPMQFSLFENFTSIYNLIYINPMDNNTMLVIGTTSSFTIYLGSAVCTIPNCYPSYPKPFKCPLVCSDGITYEEMVCQNPFLFNVYSSNFDGMFVYLKNYFILQKSV
jgi:hypothetical protein